MKKFLLLFILLPIVNNAQTEVVDLEINKKGVTDFNWEENTFSVQALEGRKDIMIKTVDLENSKLLNQYLLGKKHNLFFESSYGNYVISKSNGVSSGKSKYQFVDTNGNVSETITVDNSEIEYDGTPRTYLMKDYLYTIGPNERGYDLSKRLKKDKPFEWYLYKMNISSKEEQLIPFTPKGIEGKESVNGYTLLDVREDKFYLLSKKLTSTNNNERINQQELIVSIYDFNGNLLEDKSFTISIDDKHYKFANASLAKGFINTFAGNRAVRQMKSPATGTINIDHNSNFYYVTSLLAGREKEDGVKVYFSKFNEDGEKVWEIKQLIMDEDIGVAKMKYTYTKPVFAEDKVYFFCYNGEPDSKVASVLSIDKKEGKLLKMDKITNLDHITRNEPRWRDYVYGIRLEELPKETVLDENSIIAYLFEDSVKNYFESISPESETFYYSHFLPNGSLYMFEADYKNEEYRLLEFNTK
ncbi:hypothetical protein [Marixanthomonas ophiurae]|uniref:S9 family peptidase n=1 Tax=Marixanthomonas ophiurae TaxID=387659 RepID=A0A3E1QAQ2_9FLAO|nr:hypothetical protein [Marixanthomonas ophiurae]RFN59184.1 hypothetical protein DZ858_03675 [Marixanthomonas ophiurae]